MNRFKQFLRKAFVLPTLPTVLIAVFGYSLVLSVAVFEIDIPAIQYLSYISSAYALIITITGFPRFKAFVKKMKNKINEHSLMKRFRSTAIGGRFFEDVYFRTKVSLYQSFFVNLLYIVIKMFSGIYYRSFWFVALAIYYILLAVARFMLFRRRKKSDMDKYEAELRRYRVCGVMLLIMNQALAVIVTLMVHFNRGFDYPGILIYAMAMYAFYSVITAVVNLVKFRKHDSPVLSAAKAINLVAALVSMLSLETAMLAQFGEKDEEFRALMTGVTGGCICTFVIAVAIFMTVKSTRQLKKLRINKSLT